MRELGKGSVIPREKLYSESATIGNWKCNTSAPLKIMTDRPTDQPTNRPTEGYEGSQKVRIKQSSEIIFLPQLVAEGRTLCSLHFYVFSIQFVALRIFCKALCAN